MSYDSAGLWWRLWIGHFYLYLMKEKHVRERHISVTIPECTRMHKTMGSGIANQSVCHQNSTSLEFHPNDIIITLLASGYFLAMSPMRRLKFINGVAQSIIIYIWVISFLSHAQRNTWNLSCYDLFYLLRISAKLGSHMEISHYMKFFSPLELSFYIRRIR